MTELTIRAVGEAEFAAAFDLAVAEGWNPGLDDPAAFHATDPAGFLMGFDGADPVSCISVVRYGRDFGFLGFYIVRPDWRGRGAGIATWNAGMAHLEGRTIGLDGVVAQQDNYRRSGFVLAGRNIRHAGVPVLPPAGMPGVEVKPVKSSGLDAIVAFDRLHFPAEREAFVRAWVLHGDSSIRRNSVAAFRDGELAGYGTIRACRVGFKIGPLFASDRDVAAALMSSLAQYAPKDSQIVLDTPEGNPAAMEMARDAGMEPVFETARMYRGADPCLPLGRIFGITTFELG